MADRTLSGSSGVLHHRNEHYVIVDWNLTVHDPDGKDWGGRLAIPSSELKDGLLSGDEIRLQLPTDADKQMFARGQVADCRAIGADFWGIDIKGTEPIEL